MIDGAQLPQLQGSERQIQWANRIRALWLDDVNDEVEEYGERCEQAYKQVLERLELQKANWWIDRQHSAGPWLRLEADKLGAFNHRTSEGS